MVREPTGSPVSKYVRIIASNILIFLSSNPSIASPLCRLFVSTRFVGVLTSIDKIALCVFFVNSYFEFYFFFRILQKDASARRLLFFNYLSWFGFRELLIFDFSYFWMLDSCVNFDILIWQYFVIILIFCLISVCLLFFPLFVFCFFLSVFCFLCLFSSFCLLFFSIRLLFSLFCFL